MGSAHVRMRACARRIASAAVDAKATSHVAALVGRAPWRRPAPAAHRTHINPLVVAITTILLARHGETNWNRDQRVQGHSDEPLNDTGRTQAQTLADDLAAESLDAVYASDLSRAHETARIVATARGLDVVAVADLRERHFGSWEGLTSHEILERFPDARPGHFGDAETVEEMAARVVAALHRIAESHPGGRVLVVSHGGPLRAVLLQCAADRDGSIENCAVFRFAYDGGRLIEVDLI